MYIDNGIIRKQTCRLSRNLYLRHAVPALARNYLLYAYFLFFAIPTDYMHDSIDVSYRHEDVT